MSKKSENVTTAAACCVGGLLLIPICTAIGGAIIFWVWNLLVVPAFGSKLILITYWQACIISLVLAIVGNYFQSSSSKSD